MYPVILLLIILVFGYLSTHFIFNRIQAKSYIPSGVEYIFLGILLDPAFSNWMKITFGIEFPPVVDNQILLEINPAVSGAIGIIGLIYGLRFKISSLAEFSTEHWRLALFEISTSVVVIGGAAFGLLYIFFFNSNNLLEIITASTSLGLIGSMSSWMVIRSLSHKYKSSGNLSETLQNTSVININLVILIFGLLFGIFHFDSNQIVSFTPTEWVVIGLSITFLIGVLFFLFLGREYDGNKLFVAVIGITIFASGIAYYLNYSPLFMNFIIGAILANLSKVSKQIELSLQRMFEPLSVLIVIIAGFFWMPAPILVFIPSVIIYIILRYYSKNIAGYLAFKTSFDNSKLSADIGKGLLNFDIIACAMFIDYQNVYKNEFLPVVAGCVLASVIIFSLFGYKSAKNLLINAGEIKGEKV